MDESVSYTYLDMNYEYGSIEPIIEYQLSEES